MRIAIASRKGGVGKTTSAVHLAAYLSTYGSVLLVDGDPNRSAKRWASRGQLPFTVVDTHELATYLMSHQPPVHLIIDTKAAPDLADLESITRSCDLLIMPSTPDALSLDALPLFIQDLEQVDAPCPQRVLLTSIPPKPSTSGADAKAFLESRGYPVFESWIRRYEAFKKAPLEGCVVSDVKSDRNAPEAWNDYLQIGKEIYGTQD